MVPVPLSRLEPSRKEEIEDWPWLDQAVLMLVNSTSWSGCALPPGQRRWERVRGVPIGSREIAALQAAEALPPRNGSDYDPGPPRY